jgi:iron complex transport system ATP-binding protein
VRAPRLLLLDEPTSALDLRWQLQVLQAVRALVSEGQTLALIAVHDLNLALRFCDRIVVLGQGRVLAAGRPADVLTPALLHTAYGVRARIEHCSLGHPLVLADEAIPLHNDTP